MQNKSQNKDNKKFMIFGGIGVIIVLIIGLSWLFIWGARGESTGADNLNLPTPAVSQLQLAEDEKPVIELAINNDRSGATLTVTNISDRFSEIEYELIYTAENEGQEIERGVAGGPLEIPASREISETMLFGTESCTTGTCHRRIDKNVSKGTLLVRLITEDNQTWTIEKDFDIKQKNTGYQAIWQE